MFTRKEASFELRGRDENGFFQQLRVIFHEHLELALLLSQTAFLTASIFLTPALVCFPVRIKYLCKFSAINETEKYYMFSMIIVQQRFFTRRLVAEVEIG